MYRRYYDGYNAYADNHPKQENGEVVIPQSTQACEEERGCEHCVAAVHTASCNRPGLSELFQNLEADDLLLIGVIILLLLDSANDTLLIAVLAVVLIAGWLD